MPENTHIGLHLLGALGDPLASVAILLLSLAIRRTSHTIAVIGIVAAVVGLIGAVLSTGGSSPVRPFPTWGWASAAPSGWPATRSAYGCS